MNILVTLDYRSGKNGWHHTQRWLQADFQPQG